MQRYRQQGLAMIEIIVTVLIITIGVSGIGLLLLRAVQATQDTSQQSQAMWIVEDYVGRMRANPEGAKSHGYEFNSISYNCEEKKKNIKMCAEIFDNGEETGGDSCEPVDYSPNDMAAFDNWITICGISSEIYDSPSDFVVNPVLTSTCNLESERPPSNHMGVPDCLQYLVTLKWQTLINKGDSNEGGESGESGESGEGGEGSEGGEVSKTNINEYSMVVRFD